MSTKKGRRLDKDRVTLRKGESQRADGIYDYRWVTPDGKRHAIYASTLEALREKEEQIIISAYEKWGGDMANHIYGMFSFALYDTDTDTLFCLRDQFGTKPFYYYVTNDGKLLYGTTIREIMECDGFQKELNQKMLQIYLTMTYTTGDETFFEGVKKLLPGRYMTFKDGQVVAGLVEQMDAIQKASPHYFKESKGNEGGKGGFPGGWQPFGKSPEESRGQGGADSAAEFGKNLAKAQAQGMNSTQKAADIYFK